MKKISRIVSTVVLAVSMALVPCGIAAAETVYYKGSPVNWEHGRWLQVFSYSHVQTHKYTHAAGANDAFSGWKKPGELANATAFVGTGRATAYWDCK